MQAIQGLLTSKPFQKRLGRLFSHPIALLAIATIFATIAGVWLTNYYQSVAEWNTKLLAYKGRLARAIEPAAAEALGSWEDAAISSSRTIGSERWWTACVNAAQVRQRPTPFSKLSKP